MKSKPVIAGVMMILGEVVSGWYGPWWAPAAFVVILAALLRLGGKQSAWLGGVSLLLVYLILSAILLSKDESGLVGKTGLLLGGLSAPLLLGVTAFIGGVTGLLAGWLGHSLAAILTSKK